VNTATGDQGAAAERLARVKAALGGRSIVLVGMMGSGKTSVGRRLAERLDLPFADADAAIETAAGMNIPEIFAQRGETEFRLGERRVIARLLAEEPKVLATGGGAFMAEETRARIREHGVSVWLKADPEVLMKRVRKRSNRPLLKTADPEATLRRLLEERTPTYSLADIAVLSRDVPHEVVVEEIVVALDGHLSADDAARSAAPARPASVHVPLGERAYDILIGPGLIETAGERIAALRPGAACAIVTDANLADAHLPRLEAGLAAAGVRSASIVVPAGEGSKCYAQFERVCDAVIGARMERGDLVVALGGGVVGDLAGFVAASVRRGMDFVQIPTSLLAQVDSSVGGKTGINSPFGKNLVGAFHQPILVLADTDALDTLPEREFRAGYAEVAKYGLIGDHDFWEWLEANHRAVFAGGSARTHAIRRSCEAKAAVVLRDEKEEGDRALLNLGHTFGHAYERIAAYDGARLVHGEAVAIGLCDAFRFSARLGRCSGQDAVRVERHIEAVGLPTRATMIPGWNAGAAEILDAMAQDKKVKRGALTFILAEGIGKSFIARGVAVEDVRAYLDDALAPGIR
jgi:shikimate kinase/3-dehydroquinate synthase